jgi:hypothetical protein
MSLRGGVLLFLTKQSPVLSEVSVENEIASPPKTKIGGSQRHSLARCTVENYFEGFRKQVQHLENKITKELEIEDAGMFAFGNPTNVKKDLFTWRWRLISLSRLVVALPLFFLFFWAVILWFILNAS